VAERHGGDWSSTDLDSAEGPIYEWDLHGPDSQWVYASGRWVTHPPLEFAVQMLGEDVVQVCLDELDAGYWHCKMQVDSCMSLMITSSGCVSFHIHAPTCREPLAGPSPHIGEWHIGGYERGKGKWVEAPR